MKIYKLNPVDSHKSFYGKTVVYEYDDGTRVLKSYLTNVAAILPDGTFCRLWGGYSATTMRHVNAFIARAGLEGGGKKWWDALEVERDNTLSHALNDYRRTFAG